MHLLWQKHGKVGAGSQAYNQLHSPPLIKQQAKSLSVNQLASISIILLSHSVSESVRRSVGRSVGRSVSPVSQSLCQYW